MSASSFLEQQILNHIFTSTAYVSPNASLYLCLFTADPLPDGSIVSEVNVITDDTAYARQSISFDAAVPSIQSTGGDDYIPAKCASNNAQLFPPVMAGSNGVDYGITHIGLYDGLTGGDLLYIHPLSETVTRVIGLSLSFAVGNIKVSQN